MFADLFPPSREVKALYGDFPFSLNQARAKHEIPFAPIQDTRAYLKVAPPKSERTITRGRVELILMCLAVHAAVTWDAQSTNHFFHHYPAGYRPVELDPLVRPFAGKALMYPMSNLLFAVPFDVLLFKTRHSRRSFQMVSYAAASFWVGTEVHQSILNLRNERGSR